MQIYKIHDFLEYYYKVQGKKFSWYLKVARVLEGLFLQRRLSHTTFLPLRNRDVGAVITINHSIIEACGSVFSLR